MPDVFKPMQPSNANMSKIKFPCIVQKKWDGEKIVIRGNKILTRTLRPIKNEWLAEEIREIFKNVPESQRNFECEMQVGKLFSETSGFASSLKKQLEFKLHMFDDFSNPEEPYVMRHVGMMHKLKYVESDRIQVEILVLAHDIDQLLGFHQLNSINPSLDGTIIRGPNTSYKYGRAYPKSGQVLKIKDFHDDEAIITGFTELMHNANEPSTNNLGRTERSTSISGLVPTNTLGAFVCIYDGTTFKVGTGLTDQQRAEFWGRRKELIGTHIKFRYFEIGSQGAPRHPSFLGLRDINDMEVK